MNSCRLTDDGVSIDCTFDAATNQPAGSCSAFFTADTVALFGTGANCFWTTNQILEIDLGFAPTVAISSPIAIMAGVVSSLGDSSTTNAASSVPLLGPNNPVAPVATISTPSTVGSCEGITLDASASTGGFGRNLTFTWSLTSVNPSSASVDAIKESLATAGSSVSFSAADTTQATYVFSLTITNWMGATASTTATVTKSSKAVPTVSISGPSLVSILRNSTLSLQGVASSSCNTSFDQLTYAWTIDPSVGLDSSALSSADLSVPANTFTAGTTYTVTFKASDSSDADISSSASVTVTVGERALVAVINGGNKQYQTADTISLDASASYDPEGLPDLAYSWSCVSFYDSSSPCKINLPAQATQSFTASSLGAGKYTITLTFTGSLSRSATASVWVEVSDVASLAISIQPLSSDTVDPSQSLSLVGVLNQQGVSLAEVTWSWTLISGALSNPSSAYLSTLDASTLVIAANALTPGAQYTYKLSAVQTATGTTGSATITFSVNKAPTTGEFGCAVTSGNAEDTDFTYDFGQMWSSTAGIVSYQIVFVPDGYDLEIPLSEPSSATTFTTKLPYGTYKIVGYVLKFNTVSKANLFVQYCIVWKWCFRQERM